MFAKKSINADRAAKAAANNEKRIAQYELEATLLHNLPNASSQSKPSPLHPAKKSPVGGVSDELRKRDREDWHNEADGAGQPSREASMDPAPTRHAPEDDAQKIQEKSKYEASDVYRQKRGDRFS